jgi:UDP-glucose 4-epimerase
VRNRIGSPKLAAAEISFNADIDLDEGLRRLIAWRKGDRTASTMA